MSDDPNASARGDDADLDADALSGGELAVLERRLDEWIAELDSEHEHIVAVDRDADVARRWYVRMRGEEKDFTTVWLTLGQRTLRYESYVMPAPEENERDLYENLLRRNERLVGVHFSIGDEDAIFLRGVLPAHAVVRADVDRILGTVYATVEQTFTALLRIGYASRFTDES
ncbi:MAG: YbjN domain-containing protein [Ilumatobacter sp.]|uniref:YbjN domain-containing protein n=1 Tax=Ilumatobacter sp. TaxID=1967498 RepID=UPI00329A2F02